MVNKNIHTMKQPELGKRISELRKEKGLTQEELVEQCNINVRTIQRIEAGEVNPRSYTIKTILNALDFDYEKIRVLSFSPKEIKRLKFAWIFGVIYFFIGFIDFVVDALRIVKYNNEFVSGYFIMKLIVVVSFFFFFSGFYIIGKMLSNSLLKVMSILLISGIILSKSIDVFTVGYEGDAILFRILIEFLTFGGLQLIFGICLMQLKNKFGKLIQVIGVVEILIGLSFITILTTSFVYVGLILLIPTLLLEIVFLYKLMKKGHITHDDKAHFLES